MWIPEDELQEASWGRARLSAEAFAEAGACAVCGGGLVERPVTLSEARLSTNYCAACRSLTAPLSDTVAFLKRVHGEAAVAPAEPDRPPRPVRMRKIDERERVFAFLAMLPLELSDDVRREPPGVMTLVCACSAVFGLMLATGGAAATPLILTSDEPWIALLPHLLTSVFVHFGLFHLLGNLYFLYAFGRLLEERLGGPRFVALFLGCGVAGSLAYTLVHVDQHRQLGGASGAIAGVMGCYLVLYPWRMVGFSLVFTVIRIPALFYLGLWFLFQLFSVPYQEAGVAYSAHAGGFLAGLLGGAAVRAGVPGLRAVE